MKITEGYMGFQGHKTYYRIAGECRADKKPLLLLHGGPGSTHNYFEVLDRLADEGRAVISYDQTGCGLSPAPGRTDLFTMESWTRELAALREHLAGLGYPMEQIHILGQSFGGMLLLNYVCRCRISGVKSIILASTLPSSALWGEEQHRMIRDLPASMQEAIARADETGDYNSPECLEATESYMLLHCSPVWTKDDPECLTRPKNAGEESYITAWGPNEFSPLGNLRDFDVTAELSGIRIPTLITSGAMDLSTYRINDLMHREIPGSRWELFEHSRHMAFAEENEKYCKVLSEWLSEQD